MIMTMPINLWAPSHFPAQRHSKNWTTECTDKIDAKVSSMWYYSGLLGILGLHLSHVCRDWRCSCWGYRCNFICVKIKITTLHFSWSMDILQLLITAFLPSPTSTGSHPQSPPTEKSAIKVIWFLLVFWVSTDLAFGALWGSASQEEAGQEEGGIWEGERVVFSVLDQSVHSLQWHWCYSKKNCKPF